MATITIDLSTETERKLREHAAREGQSLENYMRMIAEQADSSRNGVPQAAPDRVTFDELTGPIASAVAASGMTDEEIGTFFEDVVKELRTERRVGKPSPP